MPRAKAWKQGDPGQPGFPADFAVVHKAVLQVTDIKTNRNKYYAIELHSADGDGSVRYRVFTHYGRTDDLETNPDAGQKESRYFDDAGAAEAQYRAIYNQKTSPGKGYKELSLASSKIGSQKARGQSSGEVDDKTLEKIEAKAQKGKKAAKKPRVKKTELTSGVQDLIEYIYAEATSALTTTVNAKITANGIETPLGILTIGQIEKGEQILAQLFAAFQKKRRRRSQLEDLSGEFYTVIPHRLGRTREAVAAAVIDSMEGFEQKQETLQLMKDMLQVNGSENVLLDPEIDKKYTALNCHVGEVDPASDEYQELERYILGSQIKTRTVTIDRIFSLRRESEHEAFTDHIGNQRQLYHGSRLKNWVGLLSRGVLMPKIAVSLGTNRTDAGWLGHGIYFGDAACTSAFYTSPGKRGTRLMAVHRVALGKMKDYKKITYGLESPPKGYDSCHGVRSKVLRRTEFEDDEYVIYDSRQQRQEYLAEFRL